MKQFLHRMLCGVAGGSRMQCVTRDVPGRGGAGRGTSVHLMMFRVSTCPGCDGLYVELSTGLREVSRCLEKAPTC